MTDVAIRPDLRTTGGEVNDIVVRGRYAGTLTLVYREKERMSGSLQLESGMLKPRDKRKVVQVVRSYVQSLIDAYQVSECSVMATYSRYDHIIATDQNVGVIREIGDEPFELNEGDDSMNEPRLNDIDPEGEDTIEAETANYYELVIVGENRNKIEYHIYGYRQEWLAEAFMHIRGTEVSGEVNWRFEPSEDQIEQVADLIVSDFDDQEVDSFNFDMKFDGQLIETIELTHEDLFELDEMMKERVEKRSAVSLDNSNAYSIVLARDDGDTLSYDIYHYAEGALPIGSATIDISRRQVSGYIDLREPGSDEQREQIAAMLMELVEKERECDTFNLTVMYKNRPIDELLFEMDQIH